MTTTTHLTFKDKIGILDPEGNNPNPLLTGANNSFSDNYKKLAKFWFFWNLVRLIH